jgi:Mn-dependent DtxR family transcriptional regulator
VTPTERIGRATYLLTQGQPMTVRHLAQTLEITPRGARAMLERLSRVVPLRDDGGVWRMCSAVDGDGDASSG